MDDACDDFFDRDYLAREALGEQAEAEHDSEAWPLPEELSSLRSPVEA